MMYVTFGNALRGDVLDPVGPYPFVQVTYETIRAGDARGDAEIIATWLPKTRRWHKADDDTTWTDVTVHPEVMP